MMEVPADDVLLHRPWLPVSISGCQLLAKSWFGETSYQVLLTDMQGMWEERTDMEDIQRRAQELNRRLRAPVKAFFSHLCEVVHPHLSGAAGRADRDAQISLDRRDDGSVSLRLKSELGGLPFYWEFHCTPAPVALVCAHLVRPLLVMSRLLQQQVDQLGGLLVRKDAEIQDYRENGATLSRERLQTDAFVETTFREDLMAKTLPLLVSEHQDALGFDADLQQLYAAAVAVAHGNAGKRKRSEEEEDEDEPTNEVIEEKPAVDSTPASGSGEAADRKLSRNGGAETAGAKMADRPAVQQPSMTSNPADRPTSKPKKKKVGLFR